MEICTTRSRVEELVEKQESIITSLSRWLGLLADEAVEVPVIFKRIVVDTGNIAGVSIPIF